ncbi:unnamed protein product [Schistocephalus solidus]|uniref:Reverse transcriptase domain-containing protein n=1 Tax=Schistocephalus solidus TaxID=70667 RepID=A0A183TPC4_SCHSO|nr:unnamed protein product [Schistocephalus solidus]
MSFVSNNILELVSTKIVKPYVSESIAPHFLLLRLKKLNFCLENELLSDSQYGFLPGRSGEVRHLAFLNLITFLRNEQQSVVVIYFDLSKAFDKAPHRRLLVKLEAFGIRPPPLDFIGSYFSNRSQKVLVASPTLDNLDTFLRFCNPDDGLQVQLMIEAGSDGFASLVVGYAVSKVASRW